MLPVDGQPSDGQHVSYLIPAQDGGSVLRSHVPPPRHLVPAQGRRKSAHRPRASAMPRHPRARREVDFRDPRSRTWLRWLSAPGLSCSLRPGVLRTSPASALFARCFLAVRLVTSQGTLPAGFMPSRLEVFCRASDRGGTAAPSLPAKGDTATLTPSAPWTPAKGAPGCSALAGHKPAPGVTSS